jgi:hypothetical protein
LNSMLLYILSKGHYHFVLYMHNSSKGATCGNGGG